MLNVRILEDAPLSVGTITEAPVSVGVPNQEYIAIGAPEYEGAYSVVPGESAQTLPTQGRRLLRDITVAPIPQNYGRIEWNGSTLSVI